MPRTAEEKARIEAVRRELVEATARFCAQHLDSEHAELAERLIAKLARKRDVPFIRGTTKSWAAGVIYALAQINFLFDKAEPVHTTPAAIAEFFGVGKASAGTKAKLIRDLCDLSYFDPELSNRRIQAANPLKDLVMVNGLIVPRGWIEEGKE